ncbi:MAG: slipin family protein [Thermoanaerobaculia bacterium]|nr:slipin family protein [Thermoanaerobaculia bacterium]
MSFLKWIRVQYGQRVVVYRDAQPVELLRPGRYLRMAIGGGLEIERFSTRDPWVATNMLPEIVRAGLLEGEAVVLDLVDRERAIVRIDGRYAGVKGKGVSAVWTAERKVEVEKYELGFSSNSPDAAGSSALGSASFRLEHPSLAVIVELPGAKSELDVAVVAPGTTGLVFRDGRLVSEMGDLSPGLYAFWKGGGKFQVVAVDRREQVLDVSGQEILTADKVTLRLNALVVYRVADAALAVTTVESYSQALYRQAQLALRAVVGTRDLEAFLAGKDEVVAELQSLLEKRSLELGLEVREAGIRDVILPGEMKEILNRVVEAKKRAEAMLLTRREETAAMRMQANTAKIFESSPTLMKLKELEVLEKVAEKANLTVVLGDGGLSERVMKLV